MEDDHHKNLRAQIRQIMTDKSLTQQQRATLVQRLMAGGTTTQDDESSTPNTKSIVNSPTYFNEEQKIFGCKHYRKNCLIQAACCKQFFTCRRCHDEAVPSHKINRYEIQVMMCMFCNTSQPIQQNCSKCEKSMAQYYCEVCKFFDDDTTKSIWHCEQCGICRVGGKDNFYHCEKCHMCVSSSTRGHTSHIERAFESNCPICGEWMQTSTESTTQPLPCQHAIHSKCYKKHIKQYNTTCPICSRTYESCLPYCKMEWEQRRNEIEKTALPPEFEGWKVEILCNDCNLKSVVPYHLYGHACISCQGYNTKIVNTIRQ